MNGVGNEVRFNEISGIVGIKMVNTLCLDRYGKTISKITISSGAITRQPTYTNVNIVAMALSFDESFLVTVDENDGYIRTHLVEGTADAVIQLSDKIFDADTSIVLSKDDLTLYLTYKNAIASISIGDETSFQILVGDETFAGNKDGIVLQRDSPVQQE